MNHYLVMIRHRRKPQESNEVSVPQLDGVNDRHSGAREEIDLRLVDDENVRRLPVLTDRAYENGHDETADQRPEQTD